MTKRVFKLRNVVAIAISLAGMTMFSGCDKNPATTDTGTEQEANIVAFTFAGIDGTATIDKTAHTVTAKAKETVDLTAIKAEFTLSLNAAATVNGTAQVSKQTVNNFTNPVTYRVTSADGKTTNDWTVTITKKGSSGNNPLGGVAPYDKAKDYLFEQMFKELSIELVTKRYRNGEWIKTEHRIFDAKGGNFHRHGYELDVNFPGERCGEYEWIYQKTGNQYQCWEYNFYRGEWQELPTPMNAEDFKNFIIHFIAALWLPIPTYSTSQIIELTEGSKTVTGKECEKYRYIPLYTTIENFFWVDKANGLLMEYLVPIEVNDMEEYECIRFVTIGVTVPTPN